MYDDCTIKNTIHSRALECLYLCPSPNTPVGHDFYHVATKQIITWSCFQTVHINQNVIETINWQAIEENMPLGIKTTMSFN